MPPHSPDPLDSCHSIAAIFSVAATSSSALERNNNIALRGWFCSTICCPSCHQPSALFDGGRAAIGLLRLISEAMGECKLDPLALEGGAVARPVAERATRCAVRSHRPVILIGVDVERKPSLRPRLVHPFNDREQRHVRQSDTFSPNECKWIILFEGQSLQNFNRPVAQRDLMLFLAFSAALGHRPQLRLQIEFIVLCADYFAGSRAGQNCEFQSFRGDPFARS